jgi:hypothetical protein
MALQMVLFSYSLGSCCCMRTLPRVNSCPKFMDIPLHNLVRYPPGFGLLAQFGCPSADGRPNYGSNESQEMHAVAPKSERQTTTPDQR